MAGIAGITAGITPTAARTRTVGLSLSTARADPCLADTTGRRSADRATDDGARDGRRLRGARTQRLILKAYTDLLRAGGHSPRAEQIAGWAGVSIRTVYNQFRDLEKLRAEVGNHGAHQLARHTLQEVPCGASLAQRIDLLVSKRARFYEELGPYARAAQSLRAQSEELRRQQTRLV